MRDDALSGEVRQSSGCQCLSTERCTYVGRGLAGDHMCLGRERKPPSTRWEETALGPDGGWLRPLRGDVQHIFLRMLHYAHSIMQTSEYLQPVCSKAA